MTEQLHMPESILDLPSALSYFDEIAEQLQEHGFAIFLDYDGTLTPIIGDPDKATLPGLTRVVLERIADKMDLTIVSGRDLEDVQRMVGMASVAYAGSHGFELVGSGGSPRDSTIGEAFLPVLERAHQQLVETLADFGGIRIERKRFAIAVHYRDVSDEYIPQVGKHVEHVAKIEPDLKMTGGKKVFELRPDIDWDKGKAIFYTIDRLGMNRGQNVMPMFIGDDVTDEDGFRAISQNGISIVVSEAERSTLAKYRLRNPDEVREFLEKVGQL